CMMEGMSYTAIANHLDCSRDTIRKIKTAIIGNIVNKVKEANFLQYLNSFKSAV
ncbi:MAG: helix-turn-helix domain-containing protein, partial [Bacillota bacterium]|nr:helix-turn-helix domain-containing protein [Bacillota bacterium]